MTCRTIETHCQHEDARLPIAFNWSQSCAYIRAAAEVYALGEVVRPEVANGFEYICTTEGQTHQEIEPAWKLAIGKTVKDGSVVWTCQAISIASLKKTIVTSAWSAETALVVDEPSVVDADGEEKTQAFVSGGVAGETYLVSNTVVFSDGSEDVGQVNIEVV